jgi:cellulose synthase/poly-beta-1,6-N-acetylglucosamine synthase-like glycosyltransferase
MYIIVLIISVLYAFFNVLLIVQWRNMRATFNCISSLPDTQISIIIAVRNEADNILNLLEDLNKQQYPAQYFEVIIANDDSSDNTAELVVAFQEQANYSLKLLNILSDGSGSPKKRALQKSINIASGELIITTDGDCRVLPTWLFSIQQVYKNTGAKLISSPVTFTDENSLWTTIQIIEFASLIGSGACAMYLQKPNMCNGANLAYTRAAFEEVGGFDGNENIASGDDEFLMHKIAKKYPQKVVFNPDKQAIVKTNAQPDISHFYQQRRRWASKWKHYDNWQISALAMFVFLANLGVLWSFLHGSISTLVIKFMVEFLFLRLMVRYFGYSNKVKYIPLVQLIYPFYVVFFGLLAQGKGYQWKGRRLN